VPRSGVDIHRLYKLTVELSPFRKASSHYAPQEIPSILYNTEVHYRLHESRLLVPILSQVNPVNVTHHIYLRSILILSSLIVVSFIMDFQLNKHAFLFSPMRPICPVQLILLDLIILVVLGEECNKY
jgi:hypothetical protein